MFLGLGSNPPDLTENTTKSTYFTSLKQVSLETDLLKMKSIVIPRI